MIIYGVRSTQLAKEIITDKCSSCGTQNSIEMYVFQKYAHVFGYHFSRWAKRWLVSATTANRF